MSAHRSGRTTVVLFTRDLRVHDHPALAEAAAVSDRVLFYDPPFTLPFLRRTEAAVRVEHSGEAAP
jgi:deoxyribodipyrimidine photolyase